MVPTRQENPHVDELADPAWFRAPSRREHWIAAALFAGFGLFFGMLFVVNRGWWFGWVILMLGVWSIAHGLRHALDARAPRPPNVRPMPDPRDKPIEIGSAARGRMASRAGFALLLAGVAGVVVLVFVRFTGSLVLAGVLVGFVLAYTLVMGWLTMRNIEGRR